MFERFTNQSRGAVVLAQEEALDLGHDYIGTEHLLLGLLREGTGSAARVLTSMNVTLDAARQEVEASVGPAGHQQRSGPIPFTPRAKKALEWSLRESLRLGQDYISTGHLLLGLIKEEDDVAVQVLGGLGADLTDLRARVLQELAVRPEQEEEASVIRVGRTRAHSTPRVPTEVRNLLGMIEARLTAIEQHLAITRSVPARLRSLDERIAAVRRDKDAALDDREFGAAATSRAAERDLLAQRARVMREMEAGEGRRAEAAEGTRAEAETGGTELAGWSEQAGGGTQAGGGSAQGGDGAQAGGGPGEPGDPPSAAAR
jgi:Clp amino terminal domain, pathogenicity island component